MNKQVRKGGDLTPAQLNELRALIQHDEAALARHKAAKKKRYAQIINRMVELEERDEAIARANHRAKHYTLGESKHGHVLVALKRELRKC